MRERGVQSRRVKPGRVGPAQRPGPPPRSGPNPWQVLAIVAIIAATAGWTTVGVIALRDTGAAASEEPFDSFEAEGSDGSEEPVAETHDAPELEALLPRQVNGTAIDIQSWKGGDYLTDDTWSTSIRAFLTKSGKTAADFRVAQGYDQNDGLPGTLFAYAVTGVPAPAVRDALIAAWKSDYPDMVVSQVKLGGRDVTKGGFGADTASSYLYLRGDVVFDFESTDDTFVAAALAALPEPGASGAPASQAPGSAPGQSGAASPS